MNGNAEVIPLSAPPRPRRATPTGSTAEVVRGFRLGWQVAFPAGYSAGYAAAQAATAPADGGTPTASPAGTVLRLVPGGAA